MGCPRAHDFPKCPTKPLGQTRLLSVSYRGKQRTCKVSYFTTPEYFQISYSFIPNLALLKPKAEMLIYRELLIGQASPTLPPARRPKAQPVRWRRGGLGRVGAGQTVSPGPGLRVTLSLTPTVSLGDMLLQQTEAMNYACSLK